MIYNFCFLLKKKILPNPEIDPHSRKKKWGKGDARQLCSLWKGKWKLSQKLPGGFHLQQIELWLPLVPGRLERGLYRGVWPLSSAGGWSASRREWVLPRQSTVSAIMVLLTLPCAKLRTECLMWNISLTPHTEFNEVSVISNSVAVVV